MRKLKWAMQLIIIAIFVVIVAPYIKAEYLTWKHGEEFIAVNRYVSGGLDYYKVLDYTSARARVFYMERGRSACSVVNWSKVGDQWVPDTNETIWSKTGSADEIMWPYYP